MESIESMMINQIRERTQYPQLTVHQLFEQQVEKSQDSVALSFENQSMTYLELNMRSNQLARYLQRLGIGPDKLVGVLLDRSLDMVVALLGILKAGGAYVPLDPSHPQERISYIVEDAQMSVILTDNSLIQAKSNIKIVNIIKEREAISKEAQNASECYTQPGNLAYVIYTSGSTGKPKGVQIPHKAFVNFLTSMSKKPGLTKDDRLLAVTTLSFDIAGLEIFLPLSVGAQVVLTSRDTSLDGIKLKQALKENSITIMQATPATWRMLIDAGWNGNKNLKILCGGEMLPRELANSLLAGEADVWNMYGPTETTIWSTVSRVQSIDGPVSIGYPIDNTDVYILDENLKTVDAGEVGELYIGGEGLACGYLNRPELTAEKFITNPFVNNPKERLYKTGDLVRYLSDGSIIYIGRSDFQVKLRGYRIELEEIEAALEKHPAVQQAVAVVKEGKNEDKKIYAYFKARSQKAYSAADFRDFLGNSLPDYMIPSYFVSMDSFPLTPNGKINRKVLLSIEDANIEKNNEFTAPSTSLEKEIAPIWSNFLQVENIGIHDNFLELGGHSLLANRLTLRVNDTFGVKLSLMEVLTKGLTIAGMARLIEDKLLMQSDSEEIAAALEELDQLSEEELKKLLEEE